VSDLHAPSSGSPYKGLASYEEADAPSFFGRDADAELVVANVLASPLTLLFGGSGVGKSSLLHAGVAPRLRAQADIVPVLFSEWHGDAAAALAARLRSACGLDSGGPGDTLAATIESCANHEGVDLVVILDQFEEYFVYQPDGGDRLSLEFPPAVAHAGLPVSFMLAIREDALARLERFKGRVPGLFDTYLRLDRLGRDAAREAIVAPLARHAALHPDEAVVAEPALVDEVLDEVEVGRVAFGSAGAGVLVVGGERSIELPYLQLVLTRLWDEERRAGSRVLRLETLERLGGADRIVRTHLDRALDALGASEQQVAADTFRYLVTPSGTKIAHRVDDLAEYAGQPSEAVAVVLAQLAAGDTRVVRPVGDDGYEIYHDVLAPAVLDWRARYLHARELAALSITHRWLRALNPLIVAFAFAVAGLLLFLAPRGVQSLSEDGPSPLHRLGTLTIGAAVVATIALAGIRPAVNWAASFVVALASQEAWGAVSVVVVEASRDAGYVPGRHKYILAAGVTMALAAGVAAFALRRRSTLRRPIHPSRASVLLACAGAALTFVPLLFSPLTMNANGADEGLYYDNPWYRLDPIGIAFAGAVGVLLLLRAEPRIATGWLAGTATNALLYAAGMAVFASSTFRGYGNNLHHAALAWFATAALFAAAAVLVRVRRDLR
jgi:hypothetical protein